MSVTGWSSKAPIWATPADWAMTPGWAVLPPSACREQPATSLAEAATVAERIAPEIENTGEVIDGSPGPVLPAECRLTPVSDVPARLRRAGARGPGHRGLPALTAGVRSPSCCRSQEASAGELLMGEQ
jgi:hypothetical protein